MAVLGGGAAGVVAAATLAGRGAHVDVFERAPILGGLHRSVEVDGDVFDIGAFFFAPDHALIETFPATRALMVPVDHLPVSITPAGSIDGYPCTPHGYLRDYGFFRSALAVGDLLVSRFRYRHPTTVPEYSMRNLGKSVYRTAGLKHYLERFYGVSDSEIDLDVVAPRLSVVSQYAALRRLARLSLLGNRKKRQHQYARPRSGFPAFYDCMAESLAAQGVSVRRNVSLTALRPERNGFEAAWDGDRASYDHIVSTIPPPSALRLLGETARTDVQYMSLLSLFYRGTLRVPGNVVYNFTRDGKWKRITVFSRMYGPSQGRDYFTVEVTGVGAMTPRVDELAEDFERHSAALSMFDGAPRRVGHTVTERAYPAAKESERKIIDAQRARLRELGILLVGRQGNNAYLSSHDVALAARELALSVPLA